MSGGIGVVVAVTAATANLLAEPLGLAVLLLLLFLRLPLHLGSRVGVCVAGQLDALLAVLLLLLLLLLRCLIVVAVRLHVRRGKEPARAARDRAFPPIAFAGNQRHYVAVLQREFVRVRRFVVEGRLYGVTWLDARCTRGRIVAAALRAVALRVRARASRRSALRSHLDIR